MADSQLDLFSRKKYAGILPQSVEILPPTTDSTVLQSLPAYHTYLSSGGYSKYTPDDFTSDVRKFGVFVKDKRIGEIRTADIQQWITELKKGPRSWDRPLYTLVTSTMGEGCQITCLKSIA